MVATDKQIPHELLRKISPAPLLLKPGERAFITVVFTGFAALCLCGIPVYRNGFLFLLGPWLCTAAPAFLLSVLPPLPSRGTFISGDWRAVDAADPVVTRLVELYKSEEARRHLWIQAVKLSGVLFAILGTAGIILRDSLVWALPSSRNEYLYPGRGGKGSWFWVGLFCSTTFVFLILVFNHVGWATTMWAGREILRGNRKTQTVREDPSREER